MHIWHTCAFFQRKLQIQGVHDYPSIYRVKFKSLINEKVRCAYQPSSHISSLDTCPVQPKPKTS